MDIRILLEQLIKIDRPWSISMLEIDQPSNRLDITIQYNVRKNWLFWWRKEEVEYKVLRHLPLLGMRTFLHVPLLSSINKEAGKMWGHLDSNITYQMESFVTETIQRCASIKDVADITDMMQEDVRKIASMANVTTKSVEVTTPSLIEKPESNIIDLPASNLGTTFDLDSELKNIPDETHPQWQRIIDGQAVLPSHAVGLKMLVQKLMTDIKSDSKETTRLSSIKILRQYFIKNYALYEDDIVTLFLSDEKFVKKDDVPDKQSNIWKKIIDEETKFVTSNVGLQMMLNQVKTSVSNNKTAASYLAGTSILRQFFVKHKEFLGKELDQLRGLVTDMPSNVTSIVEEEVPQDSQGSLESLPAESDSIWKNMLNGSIEIQTNTVSLQMMLRQLRQSIKHNPSEANYSAAIKILYQFFSKYQHVLKREIQQLHNPDDGADVDTLVLPDIDEETHKEVTSIDIGDAKSIPNESNPVWQKIITGESELNTDMVALKMMLNQVRISVERNPSDASRMAGARILRQYFIKHQHSHIAELQQLSLV